MKTGIAFSVFEERQESWKEPKRPCTTLGANYADSRATGTRILTNYLLTTRQHQYTTFKYPPAHLLSVVRRPIEGNLIRD
jgi:hypothetical protein